MHNICTETVAAVGDVQIISMSQYGDRWYVMWDCQNFTKSASPR